MCDQKNELLEFVDNFILLAIDDNAPLEVKEHEKHKEKVRN